MDGSALTCTILAALGGVLGDLYRRINAEPIRMCWTRTVVEGVASAFMGFLVFQFARGVGLSHQYTLGVVGLSGWLGATALIQKLEPVYNRLFGGNTND